MPRVKRVTRSGDVLEQEVFYMAPNTKKIRGAAPKPPPDRTPEEKEIFNLKQSLKRFIRLFNHNFSPAAYYVTQTFDDLHLPPDYKGARRALDNYFRRLKYDYPQMVAVAVVGRGRKSGRLHIHCVISGVDRETIKNKWSLGAVSRIEPLREHNYYDGIDHGRDYTALATYLFNHWDKEQGGKGKRWKQTKTIQQPEKDKPTIIKRKYTTSKPPITPNGYMLVQSRESEQYAGGYLYFKYVKIPPPDQNHKHNMQC